MDTRFFIITPQEVTQDVCTDINTCPFRPGFCATNENGTYIYYTEPRLNLQEQNNANPYIHSTACTD